MTSNRPPTGSASVLVDLEAARQIAQARWPDGVRCPHCDSARTAERDRPGRRWPQWRCRDCRKEFTAVTGTALHGTRLSPSVVVARNLALFPPQHHGTQPTGKRESAAARMSEAERKVFNALRQRPLGATIGKVASLAGVSERHTRRVVRRFDEQGLASAKGGSVLVGHKLARTTLWQLTYSPECIRLLAALPRRRTAMPPLPVDGAVPPQFWHLFWSGAEGHELDLNNPAHECHVAGATIGSRDLSADMWALRSLSTSALESLVGLRGYDKGDVDTLLRAELDHRANVAA